MEEMLRELKSGSVVAGRVVRTEPFGAFVDIGRGIVALLPTEYISAARIRHPNQRFRVGQKILAAVKTFDRAAKRITLTHKELLGTWLENASRPDGPAGGPSRGGRGIRHPPLHPPGANEDQIAGHRSPAGNGGAKAPRLSNHRRRSGPLGLLPRQLRGHAGNHGFHCGPLIFSQ